MPKKPELEPVQVVNIRAHAADVYIGRARRGEPPNRWGNPFRIGDPVRPAHLNLVRPFDAVHRHLVGRPINR